MKKSLVVMSMLGLFTAASFAQAPAAANEPIKATAHAKHKHQRVAHKAKATAVQGTSK